MPAPKYTPELKERVCKNLQAGIDVKKACQIEGIGKSTFYDWKKRGEAGEEPYADFFDATEVALAKVEAAVSSRVIKTALDGNWQAALAWLRIHNQGWKQQVELTGPGGRPIGVLTTEAADEIRRKVLFGENGVDSAEAFEDDAQGGDDR